MDVRKYITDNEMRFYQELSSLIAIPSVSAHKERKPDIEACAQRWCELLLEAGAEHAQIFQTTGNPIVYAERIVSNTAKTVLVYAHYDVMPAEPLEAWQYPPFELTIDGERLWARGADDDKGQSFIQVKAFEYLVKHQMLECNVKFIFEGEEEIGSPSLEQFCIEHKEMLRSDIILVSDTSMVSDTTPSITTGLRGLAYWEIEAKGPNRDLHSGHFGGAVANPINELCKLLAKVVDENGRIAIPHFYDDVVELSHEERAMIAQVPFNEQKYKHAIGVNALQGEQGYSTLERNSCRPSFDVCGIWGGYTESGSKTVLPSVAHAKVSCRLVANQDHQKISQLFIDYLQSIAPESITLTITSMHGGSGYICPIDIPAYKAAEEAFAEAFEQRPLAVRRGGSIPIISTFEQVLGVKTILMGFGLESNAIHSPNESFPRSMFRKGVEAVIAFYRIYGSMNQ